MVKYLRSLIELMTKPKPKPTEAEMDKSELLIPPVSPKGQYHIVDAEGIDIGFMNHPDIRDYVIELINAHIPNETTLKSIEDSEKGIGLSKPYKDPEEMMDDLEQDNG
jgi:hypothetical protein